MVEDELNRAHKRPRADIRKSLRDAGLSQWTILPGSDPGSRRRFLLAMVDEGIEQFASDRAVHAAIQRRLDQVLIYVTRICPDTEGVLLFLERSHFSWGKGREAPAHLSWCELWCRYRADLALARPDLNLRVVFRKRSKDGLGCCHFDADGTPVGGKYLMRWWRGTDRETRDLFRQRICLARSLGLQPDFHCHFMGTCHGKHPDGCASVPVLEFGDAAKGRSQERGAAARLYLAPNLDLPFAFDGQRYNWVHSMAIHAFPGHVDGEDFVWRPSDMTLFARDPQLWLNRQSVFF